MNQVAYQEYVAECTKRAVEHGVRTLQIHWLAPTAQGSAEKLLELARLPDGASVLDMGSGLGEVADFMQQRRPDLHFTLLNNNSWQIANSPERFETVLADMEDTGLMSRTFDCIMFNYSIGFCDLWTVLSEARRLLRSDGVMLVWDLAGSNPELFYDTGYRVHETTDFEACARAAGFDLWFSMHPTTYPAPLPEREAEYARDVFSKSRPILWKFCAR